MVLFILSHINKRLVPVFLGVACIAIVGCEKLWMGSDPADEPLENFESFWKTMDEKYAFFTYKNIDWQAVYDEYRPEITNDMSNVQLFNVFRAMIYKLNDGHTSLSTPFNVARNNSWYLNSPPNYNFDIIERHYLGENHLIIGPLLASIIDSVGYVHYRSFSSPVGEGNLNTLLSMMRNTKAMIIDVRNNLGGDTQFAERIASRFTEDRILTQYWLFKNGPGHDDFSQPEERYLDPYDGERFNKPVAVLTNRRSYSAANDFVLMMKALPNVTLVGDTTGGGGGFPFNAELPNGWQYRFSSSMTLAPHGFNVESGIPPDVQQDIDPADEAAGVDTIIEKALELLSQ